MRFDPKSPYDRIEWKIIRVSFEKILLENGNHATFQLMDVNGKLQTIPFHRVRKVYKDGTLIWSRLR
ncbi:MAG: RNA repair domain-containing protein [Planctomycetota bacterium]